MIKAMIVSVVVCWSLFVVNGLNGKDVPKYLPATQVINPIWENACAIEATLDWKPIILTLSFRSGYQRTTRKGYRKMVVMRDVQTQSTHPP